MADAVNELPPSDTNSPEQVDDDVGRTSESPESDDVGSGRSRPTPIIPEARRITRERARDLRSLLAKYIRRHVPPLEAPPKVEVAPPRIVGAHARLLPVLRVIPWLLAITFCASFLWDFTGVVIRPFGYALEVAGILRIVSVSGLIGFLTNWLAITMLFNPRHRRPIFGQGLIPAQRERVIFRLAKAVSEELINESIIKQKIEESQVIPRYREMALSVTRGVLEDPEFRGDLKAITTDYVARVIGSEAVRKKIVEFAVEKLEQQAGHGLSGLALKVYRFVNEDDFQRRLDQAVRGLPDSLDDALDGIDVLLDRVPEKIEARSKDIEQWATRIILGFVENLDVYGMIMSNMAGYDERKLEDLLKKTTNEQLNYIKYLGGVLGALGGLVIWKPILALVVFAAAGSTLFILDELLLRLKTS